jgi:hypothetical protein
MSPHKPTLLGKIEIQPTHIDVKDNISVRSLIPDQNPAYPDFRKRRVENNKNVVYNQARPLRKPTTKSKTLRRQINPYNWVQSSYRSPTTKFQCEDMLDQCSAYPDLHECESKIKPDALILVRVSAYPHLNLGKKNHQHLVETPLQPSKLSGDNHPP